MGYKGMCNLKGYDMFAVLVRNGVSILSILVSYRLWFLHSSLDLGMFFRRSYPTLLKHINIAFDIGLNNKAGLKQGIDLMDQRDLK